MRTPPCPDPRLWISHACLFLAADQNACSTQLLARLAAELVPLHCMLHLDLHGQQRGLTACKHVVLCMPCWFFAILCRVHTTAPEAIAAHSKETSVVAALNVNDHNEAHCTISAMTLGKRTDYGDAKYAGLEVAFPDDVDRVVQVCPTQCHVLSASCC